MGKRKIPGIGKSKGMQSGFTLFPAGKYLFEIVKHEEKESTKGTSTIHTFRLRCAEAFADAGADMVDKLYFHRMIEMHQDHSSYEEYSYIFVDELKSLIDATGLVVKGDLVNFDEFEGKTFVATVAQKDGQDAEGNKRKENSITKYEAEK